MNDLLMDSITKLLPKIYGLVRTASFGLINGLLSFSRTYYLHRFLRSRDSCTELSRAASGPRLVLECSGAPLGPVRYLVLDWSRHT